MRYDVTIPPVNVVPEQDFRISKKLLIVTGNFCKSGLLAGDDGVCVVNLKGISID